MSNTKAVVNKVFDPLKLDSMIEPLAIRVEKVRGNVRTPIPMPAGATGSEAGQDWSKSDVRGVEQWLVNDFVGGGMYAITVTDSTEPVPQKHEWTVFYSPADFPEKIPSTLTKDGGVTILRPAPTPQPQAPQVPVPAYPSAFPNGFPTAAPSPLQQQYPMPQQPYFVPPMTPWRQPVDTGANTADAERRLLQEQLRQTTEQLARQRDEQMQAQHRLDLERQAQAQAQSQAQAQAAANERFARLESLIEKVVAGGAKPVGEDPVVAQLRAANERLQQQMENDRREREQREEARRAQEQIQQQINALMAKISETPRGPDPYMTMMQEQMRLQAEATKEAVRQQTTQMQQLQGFMMNPRDIMAMAKESSNGMDQATRSITNTYQDILNMQRQAVEQVLQMNQTGGNETVQLIEKGLEKASSFAERFVSGKTKEVVAAQNTQAELARAQAVAIQAQTHMAAIQQRGQQGAGLNGAPQQAQPEVVVTPSKKKKAAQPVPATQDQWTTGPVPVLVNVPAEKKYLGRTDAEWFSVALPKVTELREGVARFLESIAMDPPRLLEDGEIDGIEPPQAAAAIRQAAMVIIAQKLNVSAMVDLLAQGRIAEFMDVLLPDAPQAYRDEVAQALLAGPPDVEDLPDPDDVDEGDEDEEEEAPVAPVARNGKPVAKAPLRS